MSESEAGLPEQTDVPEEHDLTGEPAEPEASDVVQVEDVAAEPAASEPDEPEDAEAEEPQGPTFADLGLDDKILKALRDLGYERPSPIQAETITTSTPPAISSHRDGPAELRAYWSDARRPGPPSTG